MINKKKIKKYKILKTKKKQISNNKEQKKIVKKQKIEKTEKSNKK